MFKKVRKNKNCINYFEFSQEFLRIINFLLNVHRILYIFGEIYPTKPTVLYVDYCYVWIYVLKRKIGVQLFLSKTDLKQ